MSTKPQWRGRKPSPVTPYPELLPGERGGEWTVEDSDKQHRTEMVDIHNKRMYVPLIPDTELLIDGQVFCTQCNSHVNHNSSIRWHELLHAKYSPTGRIRESFTISGRKYTPSTKYVHMAEEARMDTIAYEYWRREGSTHPDLDGSMYSPTCDTAFKEAFVGNVKAGKLDEAVEILFAQKQTKGIWTSWSRNIKGWVLTEVVPHALKGEAARLGLDWEEDINVSPVDLISDPYGVQTARLLIKMRAVHMKKKTRVPFNLWIKPFLTKIRWFAALNEQWSNLMASPFPDGYLMNPHRLKKMSWSSVLKAAQVLESRFEAWHAMNTESNKHMKQYMDLLGEEYEKLDEGEQNSLESSLQKAAANRNAKQHFRRATTPGGSFKSMVESMSRLKDDVKEKSKSKPLPSYTGSAKSGDLDESTEIPGLMVSHGKGERESNRRQGHRKGPYLARPELDDGGTPVEWADMYIETAPLDKRYPVHKLQKARSRHSDEGDIPAAMHRMTTDHRVFKVKRAVYGASVLVDDSGSMSFTRDELEGIIDAAPASVVALYAGHHDWGVLRIVAQNGKRVAHQDDIQIHNMGGNDIDYPALVWLANQPWPRIWITDGQVVSPSHGWSIDSWKPCKRLMDDAGIMMVEDATMAQLVIKGKVKAPHPKATKWKRTMRPSKRRALTI